MGETDEVFLAVGDAQVSLLRRYAALTPTSRVVDVGCGYGRLPHALVRSGWFEGEYLGIDILPTHLEWCRAEIGAQGNGRFRFEHVDVQSGRYNPRGRLAPESADLPCRGRSADVVVLFSVLTHLYPEAVRHYIDEVARVLGRRGRACVTAFLLNDEQGALLSEGRADFPLVHSLNPWCRYMSPEDPLHAIGYDEHWLYGQFDRAGLRPVRPPLYGRWAGRSVLAEDYADTRPMRRQDVLVLERARLLRLRRAARRGRAALRPRPRAGIL